MVNERERYARRPADEGPADEELAEELDEEPSGAPRRERSVKKGSGTRTLLIVLGVGCGGLLLLSAILAPLLLPALASARERTMRAACASNMRQVGLALIQYEQDHAGQLPSKIEDLTPLVGDVRIFQCPSDPTGGKFIYVAGLQKADPPGYIVYYEAPGAHRDEGLNVLFNDCSARWVTLRPEVEQQIELQRQALKAKGRELKLIEQP